MNTSGTLEAPRRAGTRPVARRVLQAVLALAISLGAIIGLATHHEPVVSVGERMTATGISDLEARWTPKWGFAAGLAMANERMTATGISDLEARWTPKWDFATGLAMRTRG
jgi:hypothetical protein